MIATSRRKRDKETSQGDNNGNYTSLKKENQLNTSCRYLQMTTSLNACYKLILPVERGESEKSSQQQQQQQHWNNIKTMALNEIKSQRLSFHCNKLYHYHHHHHLVVGLIKNKLMPSIMLVLILASFNLPTCLSAPVAIVELKAAGADANKPFVANQVARHLSGSAAVSNGELQESVMMVLVELAASQSPMYQDSRFLAEDKLAQQTSHLANRDDLLLVVLANQLTEPQGATSSSSSPSSSPVR